MTFEGKTVVITGAGSGIGRALAEGFSKDGARIVGIGRTRDALEATSNACKPGTMSFVVGDVSNDEDVARLFAEAEKVDILINNAAVYPKLSFLESAYADWSKAIEINVLGTAMCCHAALSGMLERGHGRIINLGSYAWKNPIPRSSAYSTSKGAVRSLTKAIASEIDRERFPDVLVNEFIPGTVKTKMSENGEDPAAVYPHAKILAQLPSGGPNGEIFLLSRMIVERPGLRARARKLLSKLTGGLLG